jgi:signal-induced proliferation-associated 1 like protein 3
MLPDEVPVPDVPVPDVPVPDVPVPVPDEPVPMLPLPDEPVPIEPLLPDEPVPVPVPMLPLPEVPVPVPMLPLPEVPLEPPMLPLPELPEPVEPLLLEPELLLCFFDCFFLLDLWVDDVPVLWSCALAPVPLVDELPLVCAWTFTAPNIAMATDAPSRPFSNLFIFMSLS